MNNLKKGFVTILLLLFSISTYAQEDIPIIAYGGGHSDADQEPEEQKPQNVPIDMHTSALLVAGMGLIASFAYFSRRRKEDNI